MARDPVFGARLTRAILDHADLGSAVAHQIGERLGKSAEERAQFARLASEAHRAAPDLVEAASLDLQSIRSRSRRHQPAAAVSELQGIHRAAGLAGVELALAYDRTDLALMLQSLSSDTLQVSIHPSASIGTSVFLDHATGIIIGAHAVVGDEVTIMQNVTIGRKQAMPGRAPRIGRGVLLTSGASILGDISIGDFAKIGAGSVVEHDVPAGCTRSAFPRG